MSEMICYVGLHGGGKTYFMTDKLLIAKSRGRRIITNYGFHGSELVVTADDIMELVASQAVKPADQRYPIALGIDEAPMLWDCRESRAFPEVMRFLIGECRKLHIDFYFTAQHFDDCDVKLRRQAHQVVECSSFFGKTYATDPMTGEPLQRPRFFMTKTYHGRTYGTAAGKGGMVNFHRFNQDVADSYDSEQLIVTLGELLRIEWERLSKEPRLRVAVAESA